MWIDRLLHSSTRQALEHTAKFAEERHKTLVENVANIDTPGYATKQVDPRSFQKALRSALNEIGDDAAPLTIHSEQARTDSTGCLRVTPTTKPPQNTLFHDGTNARLEALMTDTQDNAMSYDLAVTMLRNRFESLLTAIRGRSS